MSTLNHFWLDGAARPIDVRNDEDRAVLRILRSAEYVSGGLTGNQCTVLEAAIRRELRKASQAAINPSLDEAMNSGKGMFRP